MTTGLDFFEVRYALHRTAGFGPGTLSRSYFENVYNVEELRYVVNRQIGHNVAYKPSKKGNK